MAVSRPVRCSTQSMILRMCLRGADLELAGFYLDHVSIERTGRGASQHFAVDGKRGGMAGANESMRGVVPMICTAKVCAIRRKGGYLAVGLLHHPGRRFLAYYFPAIHAVALERDFGRCADGQRCNIGSRDPLFFLASLGREEQVDRSR